MNEIFIPQKLIGLAAHDLQLTDLHLAFGSLVALRSGNGMGKTTILRDIAGLQSTTDLVAFPINENFSSRVFFSPAHGYAFNQSVRANLELCWKLRGIEPNLQKIDHLLDLFEIRDFAQQNARALSQGEQQRMLLARAMASQARLLLFDEPSTNLDDRGVDLLQLALNEHAKLGGVALISETSASKVEVQRLYQLEYSAMTNGSKALVQMVEVQVK